MSALGILGPDSQSRVSGSDPDMAMLYKTIQIYRSEHSHPTLNEKSYLKEEERMPNGVTTRERLDATEKRRWSSFDWL